MLSDQEWQRAVLARVLSLYPERLSATELRREMLAGERDFEQIDAHDRAVRDLIGAGLLRRDGNSIVATHASMCFYALHG